MDTVINNTLSHPRLSTPSRRIIAVIVICILLYLLLDGILTKYVKLIKRREGFTAGSVGIYNSPIIQAGEIEFIASSYTQTMAGNADRFVPPATINWAKSIEFEQKFKSAPIIQLNVIGVQVLTMSNFVSIETSNATEKSLNYKLQAATITSTGFNCTLDIKYSLFPNLFKIQWVAIGFANTPIYNMVYETKSGISAIYTNVEPAPPAPAGTTPPASAGATPPAASATAPVLGVTVTRLVGAVDLRSPLTLNTNNVMTLWRDDKSLSRRPATVPSGFVTHTATSSISIPDKINTAAMTPIILMSIVPNKWNTSRHYNIGYSMRSAPVVNDTATTSRFNILTNAFRAIAGSAPPSITLEASWLVIYAA